MTTRDSALLSAGSAANGLLAYVFFMLASRSLGAEDAAPVAVLWSYWAIAGAVLTFPVQHWIIRRFTGDGHEATVAKSLPRLCTVVAGVALVSGVVTFVFRQPLFNQGGAAFPVMIGAVTAGSFLMGVVRGVLSGRGRYMATAASFVVENALRLAAAGVVIWAGGGAQAFGLALVLGPLFGLVWASSLRLAPAQPGVVVTRDSLALVSGVAGGSLVAQIVLTGPPVVLALTGGAPTQVTSLFLALAVWRAPYLVALGVTPQMTTALTRLAVDGPPSRIARTSRMTVMVAAGMGAMAAVVGMTMLQPMLQLAFGADVELTSASLAGLGVGTVFALGNLVLLLIVLVLGRSRAATGAWTLALAASTAWMFFADVSPVPRVVVGFMIAEVAAFLLMAVSVELLTCATGPGRGRNRPDTSPDTGV